MFTLPPPLLTPCFWPNNRDAAAVCSGKKMEEHHVFDAKTELAFTKCVEMVCESIPGCLLQMYVVLKVGDTSTKAVTSVVISALTTGFASGTISYDYDTDPENRKKSPDFYGYIPDEGIARLLLLVFMTLNGALLLVVRAFSAALLMLVNKRYLAIYMAGDMALYLLQKVARGDFHYWVPVDGVGGLCMSLVVRVMVKTIVDFTGVIQFRGDAELGGLYWTVNMLLALLASFGSVFVYYADNEEEVALIKTDDDSAAFEIEERVAWTLVGSLSGGWVVVFGVFLLLMKKEYRLTFVTTTTGKARTMDYFVKGANDELKSKVMENNKAQWQTIREDVKEWVQANWWRWKEEKPDWFDLAWQSKVPEEWITDVKERARLDKARRYRENMGARRGSVKRLVEVFTRAEEEVREGDLVGVRVVPVA